MALIELRGVTKTYRVGDQQIAALDGIDLEIGAGEFAAIIGPSGSGKSTLMHLLGCLDIPSAGSVVIDGTDVSRASDGQLADMRNRKIGFVFQSFNLLPRFNVLQNVELPMVYANVHPRERRARALAAIERVDLSERLRNRPVQLSGGQSQRVAIARALVNDPRIIFADEPTGNLDSATGESILALFRELCDAGRTIVLVTHDPAIARRTRRQIEIRDGKIVRDSPEPVKLFLGVSIGFREIWSHKFRSFLTMLGVILGVACLLSTLALLNGIATGMMEVLTRTGGIEKVIIDNKDPSPHLKELAYLSPGKTWADVIALRKGVPLVDLVSGESRLHGASITSGATTIYESVVGTTPEYAEMNEFEIQHGRMIAQLDLDNANRVAVLGARIAEQIWPERPDFNPVGETLVINGRTFTVIGTFPLFETETQKRRKALGIDDAAKARRERRGGTGFGGGRGRRSWDPFYMKNMAVVVPLTTLIQEFKGASIGTDGGDAGADVKLDVISFRVADMAYLEETLNQARRVIEGTHRGIDDFGFTTREDWFESISRSVQGTRASGGLIAAISLLVGGIGITNIMLASISERVREIGVRRAIGAKGRDIFVQFLVESTILAVIGGLLGLVSGFGMMRVLEALSPSENVPVVDAASIALAFAAAVAIGLLSGIYPAWRAARLNPIEALRYG